MSTTSVRGLRWTIRSFAVVIVVSVAAGLAAAVVGGALTDLGRGAGGLYGAPSILTALIALVFATPAAVAAALRARGSLRRIGRAVVIAGGAWIIAVGYFVVAHAADPCVNGWWDAESRVGDQPLCERFGTELNWHTRFHLVAHAAPAVVLLAGYLWAVRRWMHETIDQPSPTAPDPVQVG